MFQHPNQREHIRKNQRKAKLQKLWKRAPKIILTPSDKHKDDAADLLAY